MQINRMSEMMLLRCRDVDEERRVMGELQAAVLMHGSDISWNHKHLNLNKDSMQLPLVLQLCTPAEARLGLNLESPLHKEEWLLEQLLTVACSKHKAGHLAINQQDAKREQEQSWGVEAHMINNFVQQDGANRFGDPVQSHRFTVHNFSTDELIIRGGEYVSTTADIMSIETYNELKNMSTDGYLNQRISDILDKDYSLGFHLDFYPGENYIQRKAIYYNKLRWTSFEKDNCWGNLHDQ